MLVEVIATTLKEALDIEKSGADRIELVTGIIEGGLTPSYSLIKEVCKTVKLPVNVMVRPHSKSFVYNEHDIKVILEDIQMIKDSNANGIVFGCLNNDGTINTELLEIVIEAKEHLTLTFHRAIDETKDIITEFKKLLNYDIDIILTSSGEVKVTSNIELLNQLVSLSEGTRTRVLAGSGLNKETLADFCEKATVEQIHIGSGAKFNNNNLSEIDIPTLQKLVKDIHSL